MKILTIIYDLGYGGTQRAAVNFAIAAKEQGLDSALHVYKALGPRENELNSKQVPIFKKIEEALNWNPDIVHVFKWGDADSETASILREFKKNNIKIAETNVFSFIDSSLDRHLIDLHFHMTPWCLWKWGHTAYRLKNQSPGCVLPFIVNADPFFPSSDKEKNEFRKKYKIPQDAFLMGRVGQPSMGKWNADLFEEFYKISKKYPQAYLLVVGLPDQLKKMVNSDKIIQIDFLNSDEELRRCYGALDTFVHLSTLGESFGMVLAEAMLCQTPVVTQSTPRADNSQVYVVEHLKTGLVAKNSNNISSAIELLISNNALRTSLGKEARLEILNNYTSKVVLPQAKKLFSIMLNSKNEIDLKNDLEKQKIQTNILQLDIIKKYKNSIGSANLKDLFYLYFPKLYHFIKG